MNNRIKYFIASFLVISCFIFKANAQGTEVTQDLEQWTSIGLSKKFNKHWAISLDQEFRFIKDASKFDVYLIDLGVDYSFNKHFSIGANYRFYQNKNKDGVFMSQQRWNTDFQYKQKLKRFSISYRLRLQNKDEDFFTGNSNNSLYNLRNKLSVEYNINNFKIDPFFNVELFRQFENISDSEFNKVRWSFGLKYPLKKFGEIDLSYTIDKELNLSYNKNTYVVGLGYKFSF